MKLSDLGLEPYSTASVSVGETFGTLVIEQIAKRIGTYRYVAVCRCNCGTFPHVVRIDMLKNGKVASCGCGQLKSATTHGLSTHRIFKRWKAMMERCYNSKDRRYADWGGRGIHVCNRWHEPQAFIDDMSPSFFEGAQIDRIDNESDYSPENCRWATCTENNRNKRNSVLVTWKGKTQSVSAWAKELGMSEFTLYKRIQTYKWTAEKALSTKPLSADKRLLLARTARWKKSL